VKAEFERNPQLRAIALGYIAVSAAQLHQSALCNALHPVEARLSRWLLLVHDRSASNALRFTHEFLAMMLGANRSTVTAAARELQRAGLISYRRGVLSIRERKKLEAASCECYRVMREHFDRLLPRRA
jgi:CRP-like cAMP-binding protein